MTEDNSVGSPSIFAGTSSTGISSMVSESMQRITSATVQFLYSGTTICMIGAMISLFLKIRLHASSYSRLIADAAYKSIFVSSLIYTFSLSTLIISDFCLFTTQISPFRPAIMRSDLFLFNCYPESCKQHSYDKCIVITRTFSYSDKPSC